MSPSSLCLLHEQSLFQFKFYYFRNVIKIYIFNKFVMDKNVSKICNRHCFFCDCGKLCRCCEIVTFWQRIKSCNVTNSIIKTFVSRYQQLTVTDFSKIMIYRQIRIVRQLTIACKKGRLYASVVAAVKS